MSDLADAAKKAGEKFQASVKDLNDVAEQARKVAEQGVQASEKKKAGQSLAIWAGVIVGAGALAAGWHYWRKR